MVQVRHPTQQQPRFGIAPHGLGRIRLWAPVAVGIGEVLRCRSALQVHGKLGNGSRDQWNNAERTWFLVSQTFENSAWHSGRYRYRAPLPAVRLRAVRPKVCRRVELSL